MKKKFFAGLAAGVFMLGMAGMVQALTMTDVVNVDILRYQANLGKAGDPDVLIWINSVLGGTNEFGFKDEDLNGEWYAVEDAPAGVFAHELMEQPDYYLIKTGNIKDTTLSDHFLFENLNSMDYAVIRLADMGFSEKDILNVSKVSHLTEINPKPTNPVPEPATLMLIGSGLAGLGWFGRRKKV